MAVDENRLVEAGWQKHVFGEADYYPCVIWQDPTGNTYSPEEIEIAIKKAEFIYRKE
jgi:hypothetical protein